MKPFPRWLTISFLYPAFTGILFLTGQTLLHTGRWLGLDIGAAGFASAMASLGLESSGPAHRLPIPATFACESSLSSFRFLLCDGAHVGPGDRSSLLACISLAEARTVLEHTSESVWHTPFMDKLSEINASKEAEIKRLEPHAADLRRQALLRNDFRPFRDGLHRGGEMAVIAEVKKGVAVGGNHRRKF